MLADGAGRVSQTSTPKSVERVVVRQFYDKKTKSSALSALRRGESPQDVANKHGVKLKTVELWDWKIRAGRRRTTRSVSRKSQNRAIAKAAAPAHAAKKTNDQKNFMVVGFVVTSPQNPGGLLDDVKSLVNRLAVKANNGPNA